MRDWDFPESGTEFAHSLSNAASISPSQPDLGGGGLRLLDGQGDELGPTKGYFRRQGRTLCKGGSRAPLDKRKGLG